MTDRPDLEAYEAAFQRVFDAIDADCNGEQPWLTRVSHGLGTILDLFAADPALAHTTAVEALAAGPEARRLYWGAIDRLAKCLDPGRELAGGRELPENASLMAAGAVAGLIFDQIQAGRAAELPGRLPDLLFTLLAPYLGPRAAAEEARQALAQRGT
jgi:hypothetical protein